MLTPSNKSRRVNKCSLNRTKGTAVLNVLTNEQHQQLCYWLLRTRLTYNDIIAKIKEEWHLDVAPMMLSHYYRDNITQYLIAQRQRNVDVVTGVNSDLARNPAEFVPATLDSLKRLAWNLTNDPVPDHKAIKIVFELILRFGEQDLRRNMLAVRLRKIYLLERKAAAAEEAAKDTKLTDSEFADRMRKIFKQNALSNGTNGHAEKEDASRHNEITA